MKKYSIYFAILAMAFVGCDKEAIIDQKESNETSKGTIVSFTATRPQFTDETKATVNTSSFAWSDGDMIAIPANGIAGGYAIFTLKDGSEDTFEYELKEGESLQSGKAYYPASVATGTYSTDFGSISDAQAGFKMEANYKSGDSSLAFEHKSSIISLTFKYTPEIATQLVVKEGATTVATVSLSSPSATTTIDVPVTPNGSSAKYTFSLKRGSTVFKEVSKTATLSAGVYYSTPEIEVYRTITVGVWGTIYNNWGLKDNWKVRCNSRTSGWEDIDLTDSSTTESYTPVGWQDSQTFYLFTGSVKGDVSSYKVWWDKPDSSDDDWYGSDAWEMTKMKAYVYEQDGTTKKADYVEG